MILWLDAQLSVVAPGFSCRHQIADYGGAAGGEGERLSPWFR